MAPPVNLNLQILTSVAWFEDDSTGIGGMKIADRFRFCGTGVLLFELPAEDTSDIVLLVAAGTLDVLIMGRIFSCLRSCEMFLGMRILAVATRLCWEGGEGLAIGIGETAGVLLVPVVDGVDELDGSIKGMVGDCVPPASTIF